MNLYLCSRSPRRAELLAQVGVSYETLSVDVDESHRPGEPAFAYVVRLAREKSAAGLGRVGPKNAVVLGADTTVVVDGEIFAKPTGYDDALAQLSRLSGRSHEVLTAVAVHYRDSSSRVVCESRLSRSRVWFRKLSSDEMKAYWHTGEPADKAGSYAIQGLAAQYISRLEGSYSGVMGLPLFETIALVRRASAVFQPLGRK